MSTPPVNCGSEMKGLVLDVERKSITAICREELQKVSEDDWPSTQERMIQFVKDVLKAKGLVMKDADISKIARILRTSAIQSVVIPKRDAPK